MPEQWGILLRSDSFDRYETESQDPLLFMQAFSDSCPILNLPGLTSFHSLFFSLPYFNPHSTCFLSSFVCCSFLSFPPASSSVGFLHSCQCRVSSLFLNPLFFPSSLSLKENQFTCLSLLLLHLVLFKKTDGYENSELSLKLQFYKYTIKSTGKIILPNSQDLVQKHFWNVEW